MSLVISVLALLNYICTDVPAIIKIIAVAETVAVAVAVSPMVAVTIQVVSQNMMQLTDWAVSMSTPCIKVTRLTVVTMCISFYLDVYVDLNHKHDVYYVEWSFSFSI